MFLSLPSHFLSTCVQLLTARLTLMRVLYNNACICKCFNHVRCIYNMMLLWCISIQTADGSVNQLPPWTEVQGDIRLTPFYDVNECVEKVKGYVADLNEGLCIAIHCITVAQAYIMCFTDHLVLTADSDHIRIIILIHRSLFCV